MLRGVGGFSTLALAAGGVVLVVACTGNNVTPTPTPFPTATLTYTEAHQNCDDPAAAAAQEAFGQDALTLSDKFLGFTQRVEEAGDPYGAGLAWGAGFEQLYEDLTGRSPWSSPDGRALYEEQLDRCIQQKGVDPTEGFGLSEPSEEEWAILECITRALVATEKQYGEGTVSYTTAYRNFVANRSGDYLDLVGYERYYEDLTGRSPFRQPEAMDSFRARARECPQG